MAKKKRKKRIKLKKRRTKKTITKDSFKQIKDSDGGLVFKVSKNWSKEAYINKSQYEKKYKLSIKENENFWRREGKRITWIKPYTKTKMLNIVSKR